MSRAGWSGGKLSAPKLCQSVSTSGPSAMVKPIPTNTSSSGLHGLRDEVEVSGTAGGRDLGQVEPLGLRAARAGAACSSSTRLADRAASSESRTRLMAPPTSRRPSWSRPPSLALNEESGDFLPSSSWSSARRSSSVDGSRDAGHGVGLDGVDLGAHGEGDAPRSGGGLANRFGRTGGPSLAQRLEAQHGARHGDVERLRAARHRDAHRVVDEGRARRRAARGPRCRGRGPPAP